jgi:Ankyrin repeats (many copies)
MCHIGQTGNQEILQVCEILLENGADVDHADKEGKTALFAAASMGHLEILNILLFWGCYVDGIGTYSYSWRLKKELTPFYELGAYCTVSFFSVLNTGRQEYYNKWS